MAITLAQIQTKLTDAAAAIESGDLATALQKYRAARALMHGLPDASFDGQAMTYKREIDSAIDDLNRQLSANQQATYGIQSTKVTYRRTSDC